MIYQVAPEVFQLNPDLKFGIIIGKNIQNSATSDSDLIRIREAEDHIRQMIQPDALRSWPTISFYREIMTLAGINPNRFPVSVEAMIKRILKGSQLPAINALVDLCNAVSLEHVITLGTHDLRDIHEDLSVRFSHGDERFLPFGGDTYEPVEAGELIFTSGNNVQTRKWIWRQSELGKTTLDSTHLIFQLVGYGDDPHSPLHRSMSAIKELVAERFKGESTLYLVDKETPAIEFDYPVG
jgi:DNA/RNA-binding domain of Phe-tRNA-synthetase-like protein